MLRIVSDRHERRQRLIARRVAAHLSRPLPQGDRRTGRPPRLLPLFGGGNQSVAQELIW